MASIAPNLRITDTELQQEITSILKNTDLEITTTNKIVEMLEEKFGTDLSEQKETIHRLVIECGNNLTSSNSEEEVEEIVDSQNTSIIKQNKTRLKGDNNKGNRSADKTKKSSTKGKKSGVTKRQAKPGGYTRAINLSPELSELVGATALPRHEVVKRVWAIIKEKQLTDPNNRQFTICDKVLYTVFGVQRFHTFGMMKYLKNHFLDI